MVFFFQDTVVEITVAVKGCIVCISHQKLDHDEVNEKVKAQGKGRLLKPACIWLHVLLDVFLMTSSITAVITDTSN